MQNLLINMKKLSKYYDKRCIINNIDLKVSKGDYVGIVGISGSGKSTLLNIIGLIDSRFSGSFTFNEKDICSLNNDELSFFRNENIGYVFQMYNLFNDMTVKENIMMPVYYSKSKRIDINQYESLLVTLDIKNLEENLVKNLSGGEKQRVSIARALINNPELIIADEPTGNLDKKNRDIIINIFKRINKKGKTIVLVTHDSLVADSCNVVLELKDGELLCK